MSTTRRSFLRTAIVGLLAGPSVVKAVLAKKPEPVFTLVTPTGSSLGLRPMSGLSDDILRRMWLENPYAQLIEPHPFRPADYRGECVWVEAKQ